MKIVFFGNTKYSVIEAEELHKHYPLCAIVTIPDQTGARNKLIQSPVKTFAQQHNIHIIEAEKLNLDSIGKIKVLEPDFLVVADYRLILPRAVLDIPKFAPLNIHYSLLPKYRGPSPFCEPILFGEKMSGVTIIKMNNRVDAGDILEQKAYTVKSNENAESLRLRLNQLGAEAIIEVLKNFKSIKPRPQDESQATFTHYISKQDGYMDSDNPPSGEQLDRMIRAYYPWPGVWTTAQLKGKSVRIKFLPEQKLQVEGKKQQTIKDFLNGYPEAKQWLKKLFQE